MKIVKPRYNGSEDGYGQPQAGMKINGIPEPKAQGNVLSAPDAGGMPVANEMDKQAQKNVLDTMNAGVVPVTGGKAAGGNTAIGETWEERLSKETEAYLNRRTAAWDPNSGSNTMMDAYRADYEAAAQAAAENASARARDMAGGWGSSYAMMAGNAAYRNTRNNVVAQARADWEAMNAERAQTAKERLSVISALADREQEQKAAADARRQQMNALLLTPDENGNVMYNGENGEAAAQLLRIQGYGEDEIGEAMQGAQEYYRSAYDANMDAAIRMPEKVSLAELEKGPGSMQDAAKLSEVSGKALRYAMQNLDKAGGMMGYSEEQWNGMEDDERSTAVMEKAKKLTRAGSMQREDFAQFLLDDMESTLDGIPWESMNTHNLWTRTQNIKEAVTQMTNMVLEAKDYLKEGLISEADYLNVLAMLAEQNSGGKIDIWYIIKSNKGSWLDDEAEEAIDDVIRYRKSYM